MFTHRYTECDGGEDQSCNNWVSMSVDDHLHYFDLEVAHYCCGGESSFGREEE